MTEFFQDAHRFTLFSQAAIKTTPLQIYNSCLLFAPELSLVRQHFRSDWPSWVTEDGNRSVNWDSCMQILATPFTIPETVVTAISSDVKSVASASKDGIIEIWNGSNNETCQLSGRWQSMKALKFSPNAKMLAACDENAACGIWDVDSGRLIRDAVLAPLEPLAITFSRDNLTTALVCWSAESIVARPSVEFILWDVTTDEKAQCRLSDSTKPSGELAISEGLETVALPNDCEVTIVTFPRDGRTGTARILIGHEAQVGGAVFSPDGLTLVTACLRSIRAWDVNTGDCKTVIDTGFDGLEEPPPAPIFSPDGHRVAAWLYKTEEHQNFIGIWNVGSGQQLKEYGFDLFAKRMSSIFAPDGGSFLTLSSSNGPSTRALELTTWDALGVSDSSKKQYSRRFVPLETIAYSEPVELVALGYNDGSIELWSVAPDNIAVDIVRTLQEPDEYGDLGLASVARLEFSDDGKRLASASAYEDEVKIWDTVDGTRIPLTEWNTDDVPGIRILPNAKGPESIVTEREEQTGPSTFSIQPPWLYWNSEPILLLPSQCRLENNCRDNWGAIGHDDTAVLPFANATFSVLRFEPAKMQWFLGKIVDLLELQS